MSQRALNLATTEELAETLALGVSVCNSAPCMGKPPPMAGDRYVGIWGTSIRAKHQQLGLEEHHGVYVTVSFRATGIPYDRWGPELVDNEGGMNDFMDAIRIALHKDKLNHTVINRANKIIAGGHTPLETDPRGFAVGYEYMGRDNITPVGGEWFQSDEEERLAGLVCNMQFGGAVRLQGFFSSSHEDT